VFGWHNVYLGAGCVIGWSLIPAVFLMLCASGKRREARFFIVALAVFPLLYFSVLLLISSNLLQQLW